MGSWSPARPRFEDPLDVPSAALDYVRENLIGCGLPERFLPHWTAPISLLQRLP
jgi:hypothetical protein